jgi:hypothetical protein
MSQWCFGFLCVLATYSCALGCQPQGTSVVTDVLPRGTVARIGNEAISITELRTTAAAQHSEVVSALASLVDDARLASAARRAGLDRRSDVVQATRSLQARSATVWLWRGAQSAATDAEIAATRSRRWREFDRPESVRVVHVVVRRPAAENTSENLSSRLRAAASPLLGTLRAAPSPEEFVTLASALKKRDDFDIVAQPLPAFARDGRVVENDGDGGMDPQFAKAAFELAKPGDTSGLVESSFGIHVIRLVERLPETHASNAEFLARAEVDILRQRGRAHYDELLRRLRTSRAVSAEPAAESLMEASVKSLLESH